MDPILRIPLTISMTFEEWVSILDQLTALGMYEKALPEYLQPTDEDLRVAEKLCAQVQAFSDLRHDVLRLESLSEAVES